LLFCFLFFCFLVCYCPEVSTGIIFNLSPVPSSLSDFNLFIYLKIQETSILSFIVIPSVIPSVERGISDACIPVNIIVSTSWVAELAEASVAYRYAIVCHPCVARILRLRRDCCCYCYRTVASLLSVIPFLIRYPSRRVCCCCCCYRTVVS
jgi:hypothetical protein